MSQQTDPDHPRTQTPPTPNPTQPPSPLPLGRIARGLLLWICLWWLIIGALLAPIVPGGVATVLVLALASALPLGLLLRGFIGQHYPSAAIRVWVLRPFWYTQLALPLLGVAGILGTVAGLVFGAPASGGRWALAVTGGALALMGLIGYVGSRRLVVKELVVEHPLLPADFDGVRIAQVSDLHVGPHTPRRFLSRVETAVRDARADLIVTTGDQVDDYAVDVQYFEAAFRRWRAPLGVFGIAGNHDVYAGWAGVRAGLEAMGVTVLVNEAVALRRGTAQIWLGGTGDPAALGWSRGGAAEAAPDVARTMAHMPHDAFSVILAHNPALWPALASRGASLTLSGHTHYGQFAIPRLNWSLASPFLALAMGAHRRGHALLYINPGTNYWGLPLRIGARPEVTVVTLRRSRGEAQIDTVSTH